MPRSLADGRTKLTFLTTEPADPANPTVTELEAGIDASMRVLSSDFTWSAAASDTVNEKPIGQEGNSNVLTASNYNASVTPFRYFADTGEPDEEEDAVFQALKVKGVELWGYARRTAKKATEPWAEGDEIYLGLHVTNDNPQAPSDQGGYIKYVCPLSVLQGWPFIEVAAGAAG